MGIISRQVWEIAHLIMKAVATRLLAVPDMAPHCHLVKAQGLSFCPSSVSHFLEFSISYILLKQGPKLRRSSDTCDQSQGKRRILENLTPSQTSDQTETSTFLNPIT